MKKYLTIGNICAVCAIVLGLIAALMIFGAAGTPKGIYKNLPGAEATDGYKIAFGNKDANLGASAYMLAFIFPVLGIILMAVALVVPYVLNGNVVKIVVLVATIAAAACFLAGAIVYFLPLQTMTAAQGGSNMTELLRKTAKETMGLGIGAICGAVFGILAAIVAAATAALPFVMPLINKKAA